ncbi:hypothetical protein Tco_1459032 [Tanacetum coccineum]
MSTPMFIDPEISTQANGAQIPRVPVSFPKDPYEAIRHAYLVETDTEFKPFEDPVETETPESPHTVASPTSLPDSTPPTHHAEESEGSDMSGARSTPSDFTTPLSPDHPLTHTTPTLVLFIRRIARIAVHVPPAMLPGLSANLPSRKRSRGTSELVEDDEDTDGEDEDEEVEESSDSDSKSEDAEDEGPTAEGKGPAIGDEGSAVGDEGLAAGDISPGLRVESLGLGGDEVVPEGQQRAAPVVDTAVGEPLGMGYGALRRQEIASREGQMPSVFEVDPKDGREYIDVPAYPPRAPLVQTPPSPEWSSGLLPVSPSPAMAEAEGFLTELGARVKMQGGLIHDHTGQSGMRSSPRDIDLGA